MVSLTFSNALVASFASKSFIRQALQNVYHPTSVLNFWFGVDITTATGMEQLRLGTKECMADMSPLWYGGEPEFDRLCQAFAGVIHLAGTKSLPSPPDNNGSIGNNVWYETVEGNVAQVILIDQLARNAFRGTETAFKYDSVSLEISRQLSTQYILLLKQQTSNEERKHLNFDPISLNRNIDQQEEGPFPLYNDIIDKMCPNFVTVVATSLMHSEVVHDHQLCEGMVEHSIFLAKEDDGMNHKDATIVTTKKALCDWFQYQLTYALEHKKVIERFGRYPHRNRLLNRTSTEEEIKWLSDTENLPGWAKSQG